MSGSSYYSSRRDRQEDDDYNARHSSRRDSCYGHSDDERDNRALVHVPHDHDYVPTNRTVREDRQMIHSARPLVQQQLARSSAYARMERSPSPYDRRSDRQRYEDDHDRDYEEEVRHSQLERGEAEQRLRERQRTIDDSPTSNSYPRPLRPTVEFETLDFQGPIHSYQDYDRYERSGETHHASDDVINVDRMRARIRGMPPHLSRPVDPSTAHIFPRREPGIDFHRAQGPDDGDESRAPPSHRAHVLETTVTTTHTTRYALPRNAFSRYSPSFGHGNDY